jgi:hypothetical protein
MKVQELAREATLEQQRRAEPGVPARQQAAKRLGHAGGWHAGDEGLLSFCLPHSRLYGEPL